MVGVSGGARGVRRPQSVGQSKGGYVRHMILAVVAAATVPASASAQGFQVSQIVTSFREPALAAALKQSEATWTKTKGSDGTDYYNITFANGITATGYFTVCKPEGCMGLTLVADFDEPERKSVAEVDVLLNKFNQAHAAGKVMRGEKGQVQAQAYVIADHGVAMGNLQLHILIFASLCEKLAGVLYEA